MANDAVTDLRRRRARLHDGTPFRLLRVAPDSAQFVFCSGRYFDYRFSLGLLADTDSSTARQALLPDIDAILATHARHCIGGIGLLVALRPANKSGLTAILDWKRSMRLGDNPGRIAVAPKATHEHLGAFPDQERNVKWSHLREFAEELLTRKGKRLRRAHRRAAFRDTIAKAGGRPMRRLMRMIEAEDPAVLFKHTCFGLNMTTGNYEFGGVLAIDDQATSDRIASNIKRSWESERFELVDLTNPERVREVLHNERWCAESLFHFAEGLMAIKDHFPDRVALPASLRRELRDIGAR